MTRQLMNRSRYLAGALALTLAVVSSATCLAAASQMPDAEHHACCAAMGACGSAATVNEDCCAAEQPGLTGFAPITSFALAAPVVACEVLLPPPPMVPLLTSAAFDPDLLQPVSPPPYLLDSVFRI